MSGYLARCVIAGMITLLVISSVIFLMIRLLPGDKRTLPVQVENSLVSVEASGLSAEVSGKVVLTGTVRALDENVRSSIKGLMEDFLKET